MNTAQNQFSLKCAALSTRARAKSDFPSVKWNDAVYLFTDGNLVGNGNCIGSVAFSGQGAGLKFREVISMDPRLSRRRFLGVSALAAAGLAAGGARAFGADASATTSPAGSAPVFNILDYGAKNDGSASSTEAFRAAIQAAKLAGGGTVFVPPGQYVTGPIELVSNLGNR
jgi:Pectate lyase superfamily protein